MDNLLSKSEKLARFDNVGQAVTWGHSRLKMAQISKPKKEAQLLLAHAMRVSFLEVITENQKKLSLNSQNSYIYFIYRRAKHEPYAYIVGHKEFMGFDFLVNKNVFIPRPDTEVVVEQALKAMPDENKKYRCLDICAGSGCIGISLALMRPNIVVDSIDICENALIMLKKNIKRFRLENRMRSVQSNLLSSYKVSEKLDLIVANPPYVTQKDHLDLQSDVRDYEPKKALLADLINPLLCHKNLLKSSIEYLSDGGVLIFEFGFGQEVELAQMERGKFKKPRFFKDYAGIIRGCIFEK